MLNKKSIELSLNFLVVIILTLVIFGFGVLFISKLSKEVTDIRELTFKDLDEKISDLACDGSARVCIGTDRKTIQKKSYDIFGVKIVNVINDQNFEITVSYPNPLGYKKDNTPITNPPLILNPTAPRTVAIKKNEEAKIGIAVEVPANAISGTYIFNVQIKTASGLYVPIQKFYVEVP